MLSRDNLRDLSTKSNYMFKLVQIPRPPLSPCNPVQRRWFGRFIGLNRRFEFLLGKYSGRVLLWSLVCMFNASGPHMQMHAATI